MDILIDTNVILDVLLRREPFYKDAARICILSEKGIIRAYISATTVTDIYYIVRKELKSKELAFELLIDILKTINIASATEIDIYEAIDLKWDDFEDSVQYVIGKRIDVKHIITRNPKDFLNSQIKTMSPEEYLSKHISN